MLTVIGPVIVPVNLIILVAKAAPVPPSVTLKGVEPVPLTACSI